MINTKLIAEEMLDGSIRLVRLSGLCVVEFASAPFFYIVTGFKSAKAYNDHHSDEPTKFLVWKEKE